MDYGHCIMFLGQPQDRELSARPPVLALCYSKRSCRTPVITTRSLLPSNSCSICSHTPSLSRSFAPSTYSPPILGKPTSVHLRDAQLSEDARGNCSLRKRGSKVSGIRATNRQGVWKIVWLGSLAAIHERVAGKSAATWLLQPPTARTSPLFQNAEIHQLDVQLADPLSYTRVT